MKRISAAVVAGVILVFASTAGASAEQPGMRCVQNQLNALGFSAGTADGAIGAKTRRAAEEYRAWMSGGAGEPGWSQPALTALNGEFWCQKVGEAHPDVAKFAAVAEPTSSYEIGAGELRATFDVPTVGRVSSWKLFFEFETECENDHYAEMTSPAGRKLVLMERGLKRCSGKPGTFSSDNVDDGGAFVGTRAQGKWNFVFRDLDANFHSGALKRVRLELTIGAGTGATKQVVSLSGLPKQIPNPT